MLLFITDGLSFRWGITTENARHLAGEGGRFMNELIQQLKSRVGLDDDKAQSAIQTVLEFLKQRLPGQVRQPIGFGNLRWRDERTQR